MKEDKKGKKNYWNVRPYLARGLVEFVVAVLVVAVVFFFLRFDGFKDGWDKFMFILQPILIGLAIAYLINPIVRWAERLLIRKFLGRAKDQETASRRIRAISITIAMAVFLCIIVVLIILIVPQVVTSVRGLLQNLPGQLDGLNEWLNSFSKRDWQYAQVVQDTVDNIQKWIKNWVEDTLMPQSKEIVASVTSGVIVAARTVVNFFIGLAIAIYVLATKSSLKAQSKKMIYTVLKPRQANWVIRVLRKSDTIFGGFIIGKIIDSIIIGIICFVALSIMRMPYTVLISVIVGVTNIIPFFGPFIGAIPSVLLILLESPWQALYFLIFILILQQVDGNIIGPKILGDKTGLSTFWVLCAILVFGGLFGVPGMILGVPVFGVIYYIVQELMAIVLKRRKLPVELEHYQNLKSVDVENNEPIYHTKEKPDIKESGKKGQDKMSV